MYIEFRLPSGAGGIAAGHGLSLIRQDIETWAKKYDIPYKTKVHKYTYRLCLEKNSDYNYFALTWDPEHLISRNFVFIEPK